MNVLAVQRAAGLKPFKPPGDGCFDVQVAVAGSGIGVHVTGLVVSAAPSSQTATPTQEIGHMGF